MGKPKRKESWQNADGDGTSFHSASILDVETQRVIESQAGKGTASVPLKGGAPHESSSYKGQQSCVSINRGEVHPHTHPAECSL